MKQLSTNKSYDLEERTAVFAENVISLVMSLPRNRVNPRLIDQCTGSAGSVGANYGEASEAESLKDFIHKVSIAKKEAKETKHWLRLIAHANPSKKDEARILWKEAHALVCILAKIVLTSKKRLEKIDN